mgnify:CR=1 FL=1
MFPFLKMNKSLLTYSLIFLIAIPFLGLNFLLSFVGNILLLIFLIPLLIFLISLISFNSLKSKINSCSKCGTIFFGTNSVCTNCGADLEGTNANNFVNQENPSETTIEVKAEEVK